MKDYIAGIVDLKGDSYINPVGAAYGDGSGTHQRSLSQITSISIHHDAMPRPHDYDSAARYRQEAAGHYARLGPGLQYHFKIDNTGVIFSTRPLSTWLYVVGSAENVSTVAICLDGYLHNDSTNQGQDPTREQLEALFQLLKVLCTQHPEFPAEWPDVRPHADFSSTACCGNRMTGHIYPIVDEASATAHLLNQGVFDWPELQPNQPAPAPSAPIEVTPTTPTPPSTTINYRVFGKDGKQSGAYSLDANAWNKYKAEGGVIKDSNGVDVTEQLRAKFEPAVVPTPAPAQQDHAKDDEQDARLSAIETILKTITDFLSKIFSGFGK